VPTVRLLLRLVRLFWELSTERRQGHTYHLVIAFGVGNNQGHSHRKLEHREECRVALSGSETVIRQTAIPGARTFHGVNVSVKLSASPTSSSRNPSGNMVVLGGVSQ